jgi:hypothetical protein
LLLERPLPMAGRGIFCFFQKVRRHRWIIRPRDYCYKLEIRSMCMS